MRWLALLGAAALGRVSWPRRKLWVVARRYFAARACCASTFASSASIVSA